jgi:hypothetical protein
MKSIILITLIFNSTLLLSQIDTAIYFSEIRSLNSDQAIDNYWIKLDSSDQDLNTFCKPITQIENLVKAIYFFKRFGFTKQNRFHSNYISEFYPEMHAEYIWIHNQITDLNYLTFGFINECLKIYENDFDYLLQGVYTSHSVFDQESKKRLKEICINKKFEEIDLIKVVELANKYIDLIQQLEDKKSHKIKIIGSWDLDKDRNIIKIIKYKGDYFCYTDSELSKEQAKNVRNVSNILHGNFFQLIPEKNQTFQIKFNFKNSYYQIDNEGNLNNFSKDHNILQTFTEFSEKN